MRIIGGRHRGRPIGAPPGRDIRPTADRVREAVFNILEHGPDGNAVLDAIVLDGFAGTGAFGLEALSRGAASATLMDNDRSALAQCRANAEALGEREHTDIRSGDACRPPPARAVCDIVFLDPPYRSGAAPTAIAALAGAGWIADDAVIVVETSADETVDPPAGFTVTDTRRYGAARVTVLGRATEA